jgi:hypothetical protein
LVKKICVFLTSGGAEGGGFIAGGSLIRNITTLGHLFYIYLILLKPFRRLAASIGSQATILLGACVKGNIGSNGIWHLIFVWHCEGEGSARSVGERRRIGLQPQGVGLTRMCLVGPLGKAILVFISDSKGEFYGPHIIGEIRANPDSAGMVEMDGAKAWFWRRLALGSSGHMLWHTQKLLGGGHLDRCLVL